MLKHYVSHTPPYFISQLGMKPITVILTLSHTVPLLGRLFYFKVSRKHLVAKIIRSQITTVVFIDTLLKWLTMTVSKLNVFFTFTHHIAE